MTQDETIQSIAENMKGVPSVQSLFLGGSFGNGLADEFSDIDFILVTEDGATDDVVEAWRQAVSKTGEIVLWWERVNTSALINAITDGWTRTDVSIVKQDQMGRHSQDSLKVLFDHAEIFGGLPETAPTPVMSPERFLRQVEDFIRILGLMHLAAGREEYLNGMLGVFHLRNTLVDLLVEETNARHRGGILHLNRLITDEQKDLLMSLPPALPTREGLIDTQLAYAKAYLPRARKFAKALNVAWPERFEDATWRHLHKALSIDVPYARDTSC